ncbi:MAG: hypothetical protein ACFFCK_00105 [Promethearchaeota archaeon]
MNKYAIALIVLACVTSMVRFGHVYPDSYAYLSYIDYFDGIGSLEDVSTPFALRPVMPVVVSLLNGVLDSFLILSTLNLGFVCLISLGMFRYVKNYHLDERSAFLAAAICTVSFPVAYYGAVPLVDALAVLIMLLVVIGQIEGKSDWFAMTLLLFGVIVKEVVLFIGLYYVLREIDDSRLESDLKTAFLVGVKKLWIVVPASTLHLALRFLIFGGLANSLHFHLGIFESSLRLIQVAGGIGITFVLPMTILLITFRREKCQSWGTAKRDALLGFVSLLPLALLGLFFAYFDARFIWPLYLPLIPTVGCSISILTGLTSQDEPII